MHGAPIGRYSPSYERVWTKAPQIEIAGTKTRFDYDNRNSPHFVKLAEGQASAMGETDNIFMRGRQSKMNETLRAETIFEQISKKDKILTIETQLKVKDKL